MQLRHTLHTINVSRRALTRVTHVNTFSS